MEQANQSISITHDHNKTSYCIDERMIWSFDVRNTSNTYLIGNCKDKYSNL